MKSALESLDFLIITYTSTKNQCLTFRDSFISFPSMTKALNKAKRLCYNVLDDLVKELDASVNLTNVIKSEFDQLFK